MIWYLLAAVAGGFVLSVAVLDHISSSAQTAFRRDYAMAKARGLEVRDALCLAVTALPRALMVWKGWVIKDIRAGQFGRSGDAAREVDLWLMDGLRSFFAPGPRSLALLREGIIGRFLVFMGDLTTKRLWRGPIANVPPRVFYAFVACRAQAIGVRDALVFAAGHLDKVPDDVRREALVDAYRLEWGDSDDEAAPAFADHVLGLTLKEGRPVSVIVENGEREVERVTYRKMLRSSFQKWKPMQERLRKSYGGSGSSPGVTKRSQ